jgi:O-antigen ligase
VRMLGGAAQVNNLSGGYSELSGYMDSLINRPDETNPYGEGSIGKRLEMLRASYYVFLDNPWFGVGGYNFQHRVGDYLAENNIHPSVAHSNHPHNVIAEVLVSKGMVGMLFFSMILYVLLAPTKYGGALSVEWRLVILTLLITMATESAIVLKNNFISTFILVAIIAMAASRGGRNV